MKQNPRPISPGGVGLLDEMKAKSKKLSTCRVREILETLDTDDCVELNLALDDLDVNHTAISEVLTKRGHPVSENVIRRHRKGSCSCGNS